MKRKCTHCLASSVALLLLMITPANARYLQFQPRLEMGVMQYELESKAMGHTVKPAFNHTISKFTHEDVMPFISAGLTLFMNRLFVDIEGQYAYDGDHSGTMTRSSFNVESVDIENQRYATSYLAFAPKSDVSFDRNEKAISMGYAINGNFSIFAGYKMAETRFNERYNGKYSVTLHEASADGTDENPINNIGGRWSGVSTYKFEYAGPFIGCLQGWDVDLSRHLKGMLAVNVALAFLEGKSKYGSDGMSRNVEWENDEPLAEPRPVSSSDRIGVRSDTKGDALGLKASISWRGNTPLKRLSYLIGVSAYRYEFDSGDEQSDMNETAVKIKLGLTYLF